MYCPPNLEPIPIVIHVGDFRLQHEATDTRKLWIIDETELTDQRWWSEGQVTFLNTSEQRRRIRYRRRVRVPMFESLDIEGWTHHCWKGGMLALTCEQVLEPGEEVTVQLEATSVHFTRMLP